jgi:hypothetical protein
MLLALGAGILDKIGVAQLCRMSEHRPGYSDLVVKGELTNESRRGRVNAGHPVGKLCAGLKLDIDRQPLQHVIEQFDMLAGIAAGAGDKQIGDALEDPYALLGIAVCDGGEKLIDK